MARAVEGLISREGPRSRFLHGSGRDTHPHSGPQPQLQRLIQSDPLTFVPEINDQTVTLLPIQSGPESLLTADDNVNHNRPIVSGRPIQLVLPGKPAHL